MRSVWVGTRILRMELTTVGAVGDLRWVAWVCKVQGRPPTKLCGWCTGGSLARSLTHRKFVFGGLARILPQHAQVRQGYGLRALASFLNIYAAYATQQPQRPPPPPQPNKQRSDLPFTIHRSPFTPLTPVLHSTHSTAPGPGPGPPLSVLRTRTSPI